MAVVFSLNYLVESLLIEDFRPCKRLGIGEYVLELIQITLRARTFGHMLAGPEC